MIYKKDPETGKKLEPFEEIECTVPEEYVGAVVDILSKRKGEMQVGNSPRKLPNLETSKRNQRPGRGILEKACVLLSP